MSRWGRAALLLLSCAAFAEPPPSTPPAAGPPAAPADAPAAPAAAPTVAPSPAPSTGAPAVAPVPPPAPVAPEDTWTFNPVGVKRDPFQAPASREHEETNELLLFDLNEVNLVGIISGMGPPQGMVVLPNGSTHVVQVRDRIGRHNGRVHKITSSEVVVKESFKDFQGRVQFSFAKLLLAK
jgi:hypothetical protein